MRLLLDTNIIVDIISKRQGYHDSLQILKYCEAKRAEGYVSATTVTDVMYILRKHIAPADVRSSVQSLLAIVDVVGVLKSDIFAAFNSGIKDFEDAVQISCAKRINADYIITRNIKDFEASPIPAKLPDVALKMLQSSK